MSVSGFIGSGTQTDEDSFVFVNPPGSPYSNSFSDKVDGHLNYAVVDRGYDFLRGPGYRAGAFVGYSFLDQMMNRFNCVRCPNRAGSCAPPAQPPSPPNVVRFQEIDTWHAPTRLTSRPRRQSPPSIVVRACHSMKTSCAAA